MKRIPRFLAIVAFNLLLLFVLLEATALAAYYYRMGAFYYTHPPRKERLPENLEGRVDAYRIHPYWGFIIRPSTEEGDGQQRYNNHGFDSPVDYPSPRTAPDEILVGIYGGSAAAYLALYEREQKVLARALAEHRGVDIDRVRVLNFAQGGFKQPQQLLLYQYFQARGQELDVVINFDGFNEVALGARNLLAGVAPSMPSIEHMGALREVTTRTPDAEGFEKLLELRRHWRSYSRIHNRAWGGEAWEVRFASGFLVDWLRYRYHHRQYLEGWQAIGGEQATESASWLYLEDASEPEDLDDLVAFWSRSSLVLHRAVESSGGNYFHFVQPNQYHVTERVFSEEERQVAFAARSPYIEPVEDGYPLLETAVPALRAQGVAVEGLFRHLDTLPVAAYVDSCCHFTDPAQQALLEHISEVVVKSLESDKVELVDVAQGA